MNLKKALVLSGLAVVIMAATQVVFAEEAAVADSNVAIPSQQSALEKESEIQWAWGEVTNLDNSAKTVTLKYLDYETDQEKELVLVVDEKTAFENISDFNALKLKDILSIDYSIGTDNKNIAKQISFEEPDAALSTPVVEDSEPAVAAVPVISGDPAINVSQSANSLEAPVSNLVQPAAQSAEPEAASSLVVSDTSAPVELALAPVEPEAAPVVQEQAQ